MGAGIYFAIIVIIFTVMFYTQVSEAVGTVLNDLDETSVATKLKPTAAAGQEICDAKIIIRGDITDEFGSVLTDWRLGEESVLFGLFHEDHGAFETVWLNCTKPEAALSFLNLIPVLQLEKLEEAFQKLSFFVSLTTETYDLEITLTSGERFFDRHNKAGMTKQITVESGLHPDPLGFKKIFLIENIPKQQYTLEVVIVGEKINGMTANKPYTTPIFGDIP